jgi:hypothetical protein
MTEVTEVKPEPTAALSLPLSSDDDGNIFDADGDIVGELFWIGYHATRGAFIVQAVNSHEAMKEALRKIAGGFEGEGLEIENQWRMETARAALSGSPAPEGLREWLPIETAPKDGTHVIGLTQFGAREIWWHQDSYEGEFWQDEGDSEPEPTHWVPMPVKARTALAGVTAPQEVEGK